MGHSEPSKTLSVQQDKVSKLRVDFVIPVKLKNEQCSESINHTVAC